MTESSPKSHIIGRDSSWRHRSTWKHHLLVFARISVTVILGWRIHTSRRRDDCFFQNGPLIYYSGALCQRWPQLDDRRITLFQSSTSLRCYLLDIRQQVDCDSPVLCLSSFTSKASHSDIFAGTIDKAVVRLRETPSRWRTSLRSADRCGEAVRGGGMEGAWWSGTRSHNNSACCSQGLYLHWGQVWPYLCSPCRPQQGHIWRETWFEPKSRLSTFWFWMSHKNKATHHLSVFLRVRANRL